MGSGTPKREPGIRDLGGSVVATLASKAAGQKHIGSEDSEFKSYLPRPSCFVDPKHIGITKPFPTEMKSR